MCSHGHFQKRVLRQFGFEQTVPRPSHHWKEWLLFMLDDCTLLTTLLWVWEWLHIHHQVQSDTCTSWDQCHTCTYFMGWTKIDRLYYHIISRIVRMMVRHDLHLSMTMLVWWVIYLLLYLLLFYHDSLFYILNDQFHFNKCNLEGSLTSYNTLLIVDICWKVLQDGKKPKVHCSYPNNITDEGGGFFVMYLGFVFLS